MDRDKAGCELIRLLNHYSGLPFSDLCMLADGPVIESELPEKSGLISLSVEIFRGKDDCIFVNVMAHGNNWWKMESLDETICVKRPIPGA